jgi:PAS domain S-box-containing protein
LDTLQIEQRRVQRTTHLNVIQMPVLRLLGFLLLSACIFIHDLYFIKSFSLVKFAYLTSSLLLYSLISWIVLYRFYLRVKVFDLGLFFLIVDVFIWTLIIYFTGGEKSLFFFLMTVRAADLSGTTFRRVLFFGHLSLCCYLFMLLYLIYVEERPIVWVSELPKLIMIYALNLYIAFTARAGEENRNQTAAVIRMARDLIQQLDEQSRHLAESKSHVERLSRQNDLLLRSAGEGIYGLDRQGYATFVNPATAHLSGYDEEELLGKAIHDVLHHSRANGSLYPWETSPTFATLATGAVHRISDGVLWRKDASCLPIEYVSTPIREGGEIIGAVVTFNDVSERKRAEAALHLSEERYALAVNAGKVGVWDWDIETGVIYLDPIVKAFLGYEDHEIPNRIDDWSRHIHPSDAERVMAAVHACLAGSTANLEVEHRMLHKNGGVRCFLARGTVFRDGSGQPYRMVGTDTDITERKWTEDALHEAESIYRRLVENANDYIAIVQKGITVYRNPSYHQLIGYTVTETLGQSYFERIAPEDRERLRNYARRRLSGAATPEVYEAGLVTRDGRRVSMEIKPCAIEYQGQPAMMVVMRDITERKRAQETLRRAHDDLELRVKERTAELLKANADLHAEIRERQRAEVALRDSHNLLQAIIEGTTDAVFVKDLHGRYMMINAAGARFLGKSVEAVIGNDDTVFFAPEASRETMDNDQRIMRSGETQTYEVVRTAAGATRTFLVAQGVYRDHQGHVVGLFGIARDITERKRAEDALAAEARFLRTQTAVADVALSSLRTEDLGPPLLETIGDAQGYAYGGIWRLSEDGRTVKLVASFGANTPPFLGLTQDLNDPTSFAAQIIRTRRPAFINHVQETPFGAHPMTHSLRVLAALGLPLVGRTGHVVGCMMFADVENAARFTERDLTQGVVLASQVAQALENSALFSQVSRLQEQYRIVTDALNDAVFTLDTSGRFTFGNDAGERLTGYRLDELIGHPFTELMAREDLPVHLDRFHRALSGEAIPPHIELELIRKDGSHVPIELSMANLILNGRIVGRVGVARDITERRHADAQIKASLQEKEVLLREIHHRVKNNLQIISSLLNLQARDAKAPHVTQMLRESQNRVRSMALIHENLYQSVDMSRIDFTEYAKNLTTQLFRSYGVNPKSINIRIQADNIFFDVNTAIPCGLIINELISNSLKYAFPDGKNGEIYIDVSHDHQDNIQMVIGDNGIGLSARGDVMATNTLGLKLVAALINQLSATLTVDQSNGTRFCITLAPEKMRYEG